MASASIFSSLLRPVKSVAEYSADYDVADGNKLKLAAARMGLEQSQRGMADDQAMRAAFAASGGDKGKYRNALTELGRYKEVQALDASDLEAKSKQSTIDKNTADVDKDRLGMAEKRINIMGQSSKYLMENPTLEGAMQVTQYLMDQGVIDQGMAQKTIAELQANPTPEYIRQRAEQAFRTALGAKEQLESRMAQNRGGTAAVVGVDPVTHKARDLQSAPITQSADNLASQQQSDKNNRRSTNASMANAAATRSMAQAQQDQTRAWQNESRALQLDKLRSDKEGRERSKQASIDSVNAQLTVIDKALDHPGRKTATGMTGAIDPRNYIPGTQATDFRVVLDQINGTAFLQAFESLKGGGQITNVEGQKGSDAIARLNRAQSDEEFEVALQDLRGVMEKGYERLTGEKAPQRPKSAAKGGMPDMSAIDAEIARRKGGK